MAVVETEQDAGRLPLAAIVLAVFMLMLDATVVTVALPAIGRDVGGGPAGLQWVLNAYTIAMAAIQLTAGALADRYGRRRMFLGAVGGFALASLACGLAPSAGVLLAARVAQGLSGAAIFATTLALIGRCYTGAARGTAFAVRGATAGIAVVLGPVVGGLITAGLGWRWIFLLNLPVAAVAVLIGRATLPRDETARRDGGIDVAGPILWAAALIGIVHGLLTPGARLWILAGAGALTVFLAVESRLAAPMLDLRMFGDRRFAGTQIGSFAVQASAFALLVYFSVYFQDHLGQSVVRAGLSFLPIVVPIMLAGAVVGPLLDRVPPRLVAGPALVLIGAGLVLMLGVTARTGFPHLVPGLVLAGLGCGTALPALGSLAVDVPEPRIGVAAGVNNTALQLGLAVGIAAYAAILGRFPATPDGFADGLNHLIAVGGGIALTGAAITTVLLSFRRPSPRRHLRRGE